MKMNIPRGICDTFILVVIVFVPFVSGGNVLISVTCGEGSHYMAGAAIGEALVRRGHNVTVLIGDAFTHRADHPVNSKLFNFEIFKYPVPAEKVYERFEKIFSQAFEKEFKWDMIRNLTEMLAPFAEDCRAVLGDLELMGRLESAKFDVTVFDITWLCSLLIASHLNTTNVLFNPMASQYYFAEVVTGAPFIPAVVPDGFLCYPQKMTFFQRVINVVMVVTLKQFMGLYFTIISPVKEEFGILADSSLSDFVKDVDLMLMNMDPAIDYVAPYPPAAVLVGGLLTRPAEPLEQKLADFMDSAGDDGVIILSLGTYVKAMPQRLNNLFASVFARLPQKVAWQLPEDSPTTLTDNIKTMDWLPQNDLLGHPNTKLFIYQGGNNGLYEALYHGVPVIVLPVYADQLCVGSMVSEKGMGLTIDIHSMTAENLVANIQKVIHNKTYAETAKRLSAIYRDRPETPADRAAFWVEHVIKFGGKYMESPAKELNLFQLYVIDVIAFLCLCVFALLIVIFFLCRCLFRCCKGIFFGRKPKQD